MDRAGLLALLALAALLRFGGLSHDLHEGRIYHPDAPKQIRAVQQFWAGEYYRHIGLKDYDGYPLLHAHLVEYALRVVEPVRLGALHLLGVPVAGKGLLEAESLYWIVLLMNAGLSTAGVFLVFRMGRENVGPAAGWIAGLLLAVSPADITAAHMATGDTTTAFFFTLALWQALRVYRLGRLRDYLWCTAFATFAFAAKYYSATAFFVLAVAHLFRQGIDRPAYWFNAESWRKIGWCAAVLIGSLFLAIPGLFTHFTGQLTDVWNAMLVSTQRFPPEYATAGRGAKFVYSMRVNLPDLLRCVTVVVPIAALAAVISPLRRDARVWMLLVAPVLYVFLAVGSRGPVNPVYHSSVTPPLFLLVGLCAQAAWMWRPAGRVFAVAAPAVALWLLAPVAYREMFFSRHMDTRRLSEEWTRENVPASFRVHTGRYTFERPWTGGPGTEPSGHVTVSSELDPMRNIPSFVLPFHRFALEREPLTQFRNIPQQLTVWAPEWLRSGFVTPVTQTWPSEAGNEFILAGGPRFLRDELSFDLSEGESVTRRIVSIRRVTNAWVVARAGTPRAKVRIQLGRQRETLRLAEQPAGVLALTGLRDEYPSTEGLHFQRLEVESPGASARVTVALDERSAGVAAANAGLWSDAFPLLRDAALTVGDPLAAALALRCARQTGTESAVPPALRELAAKLNAISNTTACFAVFGLHPGYLDGLPFISVPPEKLESEGCLLATTGFRTELVAVEAKGVENGREIRTRPMFLDPGPYRIACALSVRAPAVQAPPMVLELRGTDGRVLESRPVDPAADHVVCSVPTGAGAVVAAIRWKGPAAVACGGLEIRPDILGNLQALAPAATR